MKDIREYLPFYLGQKVETPLGTFTLVGIKKELREREKDYTDFIHRYSFLVYNEVYGLKEYQYFEEIIKPLLRPLSKLTIEDSIEIVTEAEVLTSDCFTFLNNFINDKSRCSFITAKKLIDGLRKYGYDADDLIPEALDITTQKI